MKSIQCLGLFFYFMCASLVFAQNSKRDVPFTKSLLTFINKYYNSEISSQTQANALYQNALNSVPVDFDEYQNLVHQARCQFYLGMYIMGDYDLTGIESIKSMTDTSDNAQNLTQQARQKKANAASHFDKTILLAGNALKIRSGSDAYLILTMGISSNCTVKNTSYIFLNGLKVSSYAKKAIEKNPSNTTAYYYQYAQDIYAPAFFANYTRGLNKMQEFFNNSSLAKENFDIYFFTTAIAYACSKLKDYSTAIYWYKKALEIYPKNNYALQMLSQLEH